MDLLDEVVGQHCAELGVVLEARRDLRVLVHPVDEGALDLALHGEREVAEGKFTISRAHAVTDRDAYVRVAVEATGHVGGWQWFQIGHDDFDRDWVEDEVPVKAELELMISDEESVSGYTVLSVSATGVPEPREPDDFDYDDDR